MIYVCGDTHIPLDIGKLSMKNFSEQAKMTRNDFVIILGDFGLLWRKDKTFFHWLKWLEEKPFTLLWLDGNHENHEWLRSLPLSEWHGGMVHRIAGNILHLERGSIFSLEEKYFFVMGGAASVDRTFRVEGSSWWRDEVPSMAQAYAALQNIESHHAAGRRIDFVLSHTCPEDIIPKMFHIDPMPDPTSLILTEVQELVQDEVQGWYFGHWHEDVDAGKYHCLYDRVLRIL